MFNMFEMFNFNKNKKSAKKQMLESQYATDIFTALNKSEKNPRNVKRYKSFIIIYTCDYNIKTEDINQYPFYTLFENRLKLNNMDISHRVSNEFIKQQYEQAMNFTETRTRG